MELTQTLLVRAIPDVHEGVRSAGRERAVLLVESNGIDGKDIFDLAFLDAVAFERVLLLLNFGIAIEELHSNTAYAANTRRRTDRITRASAMNYLRLS